MRRLGLPLVLTALVLGAGACSGGDDSSGDGSAAETAGFLRASDMPFDDPKEGQLKKPDPLTQLATSCLGIEQDVLYDAGWTVDARKFYDNDQWSVTTAVLTPPDGATGSDGLRDVRSRAEKCMAEETKAGSDTFDLGKDSYAFEVLGEQDAVDSARAYVVLDDGNLAQISIQELPTDEDVRAVLAELASDV